MHIIIVRVCWFSPAGKIFADHSIPNSLINVISTYTTNIAIDMHGKLAQGTLSIGDDFHTGAYLQ